MYGLTETDCLDLVQLIDSIGNVMMAVSGRAGSDLYLNKLMPLRSRLLEESDNKAGRIPARKTF